MKWDTNNCKYWDVGEAHNNVITLTKDKLYKIMLALILCDGKLHSSFSLEKKLNSTELMYPKRYCAVVLRISLPIGAEEDFEKISGFIPTTPRKVTIN
jgi:hypothetical protein